MSPTNLHRVHAVRAGPLQGGGQHGGVRDMPQGHLPRDAGGDRARQLRRMLGKVLHQWRRGTDELERMCL